MGARTLRIFCILASLATVVAAFAQEGHPLKGSWIGDWGPNKTDRNQITIVIDWDGKQVTGILNPGPGSIPIQKASLETKGWIVHFEVDAKNAAGQTVTSSMGTSKIWGSTTGPLSAPGAMTMLRATSRSPGNRQDSRS